MCVVVSVSMSVTGRTGLFSDLNVVVVKIGWTGYGMIKKIVYIVTLLVSILFIVLGFCIMASGHLVGIDPGTVFIASGANTSYVLWDTSMRKLSIDSFLYFEDCLFSIRPTTGNATVDINHWRVPKIDLEIRANTLLTYDLRGYVQQKHYRLYVNGIYQSARANENGSIAGEYPCTGVSTFSTIGEWDINLDGVVNYLEVSLMVGNYCKTGERGWIPSDINDDGLINYIDVSFVVSHYGD